MRNKKQTDRLVLRYLGELYVRTEDAPKDSEPLDVESSQTGKLNHCLDGSLLPKKRYTLANPKDLENLHAVLNGARYQLPSPIQLLVSGHHFIGHPSVPRGCVRFTNDDHNVGPTNFDQDATFKLAYAQHINSKTRKYFGWIRSLRLRVKAFFSGLKKRPDSLSARELDAIFEKVLKERNPDDPDET